jgi:hypothetical protein
LCNCLKLKGTNNVPIKRCLLQEPP